MGTLSPYRFGFQAMAGDHEIQLLADSAAAARIEAKFSRYRDDSVTTRINRAASFAPVAIDPETHARLTYADRCFR